MNEGVLFWLSHFSIALVITGFGYCSLLVTLLTNNIGKMTHWDTLGDGLRTFLEAKKIQICVSGSFVEVSRLDDKSYNGLIEFIKQYKSYSNARNKVLRLCNDKSNIIVFSVLLSIIYASFILVLSVISESPPIEVSDTYKYLISVVAFIFILGWFLPIYIAYSSIDAFISTNNQIEKNLKNEHGDFYNIDDWVLKDQ